MFVLGGVIQNETVNNIDMLLIYIDCLIIGLPPSEKPRPYGLMGVV